MADKRALTQLRGQGDELFNNRGSLLTLWQEQAENFYPQRADFTAQRSLGTDFAANLLSSYPLMVARDLGNAFGSMLRNMGTGKPWMSIRTDRQDREDTETRQYLAWATKVQFGEMYDRRGGFVRATKQADMDFAVFGQAVIQSNFIRPNYERPHLLHRSWHLRDCAWIEDYTGRVNTMFRKWEPYAWEVCAQFKAGVSQEIRDKAQKNPYEKIKCWHILMPSDRYNSMDGATKINERLHKYVSIFFVVDEMLELETLGQRTFTYTVPRWQCVSGSPYAHSPAVVAALPDARLIQAITRVLLEAGEKATNPPMLGVRDAIRSDLELFAGGFTAVDGEYDHDLKEVLQPLNIETKGLTFGEGLLKDIREQLTSAFMLNKLNLPPTQGGRDMTAYEVGQRIQEYIRNALPLFEPMETDYNGQLCEVDYELLMENWPELRLQMPRQIAGAETRFVFESPLKEASEKAKIGQFQEAAQILTQAIPLDPTSAYVLNNKKMVREVMLAIGQPEWLNTEAETDNLVSMAAAKQQQQELLAKLGAAAKVAKDAGTGFNAAAQGIQPSMAIAA